MIEIPVNATGSGGPIAMVEVADEQFVVAWTDAGFITCARFSATGAKLGDPFVVNGPDAPATWPVLAMTPQGFVVAWTSGHNVFLQPMAADGSRTTGPLRVNGTDADATNPPAMTQLLDGSIVVCWADAAQDVVRMQIFSSAVTPLHRSPLVVNVPTDNVFGSTGQGIPHGPVNCQPAVTPLTVGDTGYAFVVAWQRGGAGETLAAHYRFFNEDGTPGGDEQMAKYDLECRPNSMAPLPGGGFCGLRLAPAGNGTANVLMADSYDSAGGFRSSANITHVDAQTLSTAPTIALTPTADFVIVWAEAAEHVSGDPGRNIRGMSTGRGLTDTGAVTISSPPPGDHDNPRATCVTTDSGFTTAVAWVAGRAVTMRVLNDNDLLHDV